MRCMWNKFATKKKRQPRLSAALKESSRMAFVDTRELFVDARTYLFVGWKK